jgi:hypothetical protein
MVGGAEREEELCEAFLCVCGITGVDYLARDGICSLCFYVCMTYVMLIKKAPNRNMYSRDQIVVGR